MSRPINRLIDTAVRCTVCGAGIGQCDCWTKCNRPGCSWSYRKGTTCQNPEHRGKDAAGQSPQSRRK